MTPSYRPSPGLQAFSAVPTTVSRNGHPLFASMCVHVYEYIMCCLKVAMCCLMINVVGTVDAQPLTSLIRTQKFAEFDECTAE